MLLSPPVAITFMSSRRQPVSFTRSSFICLRSPSTRPLYPRTIPLCTETTVFLPRLVGGISNGIAGICAAFAKSELKAVRIPGAIATPAIFAFASIAVNERAVPKSVTIQGHL